MKNLKNTREFCDVMVNLLSSKLGAEFTVNIQKYKTNEEIQYGLIIRDSLDWKQFIKVVEVSEHFDDYKKGMSLSQIADNILSEFTTKSAADIMLIQGFHDFSKTKSKIAFAVKGLKDIGDLPHIRVLNMAVYFYIIVERNELEITRIDVTSEALKLWGIELKTLIACAIQNTPELLNCRFTTVVSQGEYEQDMQAELYGVEEVPCTQMYTLTNEVGIQGAAVILYPNILKDISQLLADDLIILPSSVHETIIIPMQEAPDNYLEEYTSMVMDINKELDMKDVLTNTPYQYLRNVEKLEYLS